MKKQIIAFACVVALFCTSCASYEACSAQGMTADAVAIRSAKLLDAEIRVGDVTGGRRTDPRVVSNVGNVGFRKALEFSLARSGLYSQEGELILDAMIINEDVAKKQMRGVPAYTVEELVRYTLRERKTGKKIFEGTFVGSGTGTPAAYIDDRLRLAKERAMKMSIENFLAALDRELLCNEKQSIQSELE